LRVQANDTFNGKIPRMIWWLHRWESERYGHRTR